VRHARLNTQRKILEAMWQIWLRRRPFDPNRFFPTTATASTLEVKAARRPYGELGRSEPKNMKTQRFWEKPEETPDQSDCSELGHTWSSPFRVNADPVHFFSRSSPSRPCTIKL
jgi:hypothetical protein